MSKLTYQSEVGAIKTLVLKHARDAFVDQQKIDAEWQALNYHLAPDFARAQAEYDELLQFFEQCGIEPTMLPHDNQTTLDAIYVRDASVLCDRGVVLCNMGKPARRCEPAGQEKLFRQLGLPILGSISGAGRLEGGDVAWIDPQTIAVGRGYRSNDTGIQQLAALLGDAISHLEVVHLPHYKGPNDVFHLMSIFSPVDHQKALVYSPLMPVTFREFLQQRDFALIEVPDEEFASLGCNVLAIAPGICLAKTGNPITRQRLEQAGVEIHLYTGDEISAKGEGGPTCLSRPLLRCFP